MDVGLQGCRDAGVYEYRGWMDGWMDGWIDVGVQVYRYMGTG